MVSDESQGNTHRESHPLNKFDGVRYCDPHQGFTTLESMFLDGANGRMKDDFRGIFRGLLTTPTLTSCKHAGTNHPPNLDCEDPSVDRESEFTPITAIVPCIDYLVGMFKVHICTVAVAVWDGYDSHDCDGTAVSCLLTEAFLLNKRFEKEPVLSMPWPFHSRPYAVVVSEYMQR